jgi:hypothetical protein
MNADVVKSASCRSIRVEIERLQDRPEDRGIVAVSVKKGWPDEPLANNQVDVIMNTTELAVRIYLTSIGM